MSVIRTMSPDWYTRSSRIGIGSWAERGRFIMSASLPIGKRAHARERRQMDLRTFSHEKGKTVVSNISERRSNDTSERKVGQDSSLLLQFIKKCDGASQMGHDDGAANCQRYAEHIKQLLLRHTGFDTLHDMV